VSSAAEPNSSLLRHLTGIGVAACCDERVCLSVCLSVHLSLRQHISRNYTSDLHRISCYLWPWLGPHLVGVAIDVLPVLWMTLYVHTVGQMEACRSMPVQRVTSLRRRGLANAADASNWLRRVLDHVGAETGRVHRARGAGGRARGASVLCCYVSLTSDGM